MATLCARCLQPLKPVDECICDDGDESTEEDDG